MKSFRQYSIFNTCMLFIEAPALTMLRFNLPIATNSKKPTAITGRLSCLIISKSLIVFQPHGLGIKIYHVFAG